MDKIKQPNTDSYWICPLYAFKYTGSENEIELDSDVSIWQIPNELRNSIDKTHEELYLRENKVEWAIKIPLNPYGSVEQGEEISIGNSNFFLLANTSTKITIDAVTALRLHHGIGFAPAPIFLAIERDNQFFYANFTKIFHLSKSGNDFYLFDDTYNLHESEIDSLKELWCKLHTKQKNGELKDLQIALKRFNTSYTEGYQNRILDHMIALESLYLETAQELSYKLALRASFFLTTRVSKKRKQLFKHLKDAYNARSKIIHGGNPPDIQRLKWLSSHTEEYLRLSIKRILDMLERYPLKKLKTELYDQNILESSKLLKV